jgi:putative ABC transport system permease protein
MAARNVLRQKRRTLLTALTITGGFALAVISIGWSDGSYNVIIEMFTRTQLGHIQVHAKGYLDRPSLYKTIDDYKSVGATIGATEGVTAWAPRIYHAGIAAVGDKAITARLIGIDPEQEANATRFDKKIVTGRTFSSSSAKEAILGKGLAEILKAKIGDSLVILSQGADGSIANDLYVIVGTAASGDEAIDQATVFLGLTAMQDLLVLSGRVHELVVIVDELDDVRPVVARIKSRLARDDLSVDPWQEFAKSFYNAMSADKQGMWIMLAIVLVIVAVGVLNTVLMSVLERTREYGVLRALGARPAQVSRLVLYEVGVIAIGSILVGCPIGFAVNSWLAKNGIAMPTPLTYGGVEFTRMYSEINLRSFLIPAVIVFCVAVLVSLFPAMKAARTAPARAMRNQ